jgi:signal transduction histidine kinase
MRYPLSLRSRLLLALMLMTLLTLGVVSALSALLDLRLVRGQIERDLEVLTTVVGQSSVSALVFDSPESAEQRLETLAAEYQIQEATLYDAEGRQFARWQRAGATPLAAPPPAGDRCGSSTLLFDGRPVGRLVVTARLSELARQARLYSWLVAGVALVTLSLALVVALHLLRRISWPITTLQGSMRDVTERGDFSVRVPELAAGREIDALARGFNRMLGRIEQRDNELRDANDRLRRLASDLSQLEEAEKARLSEELHDGPMQKLALAQIQISAAVSDARVADADADQDEAQAQFIAGIQLLREAIGELRTLQFELSPPVLHERGLAAALDWLAGDTRERWGIDLSCHLTKRTATARCRPPHGCAA